MAFCGVFAALAITITCLGGLIPASTFVCPMLSMLILSLVLKRCGSYNAWAWYGAVMLLSILLGPDKEAAAAFAFLGYYPILKQKMDKMPLKWVWKVLLFNTAVLLMYWMLIHIFGMAQILDEFKDMGTILTIITLLLGNITFFLLDRLLSVRFKI